ncbi:hypothetical protein J437_LFUL016918 [Ladona fulva]|uniref:Uncharacterized protein n=1 Tax=Ladona fulva TaxID=123851 RepID=A0A8K0P920_LADFU|nr:hypothetical protein J437_LFUL016918 [Ladona fulva]
MGTSGQSCSNCIRQCCKYVVSCQEPRVEAHSLLCSSANQKQKSLQGQMNSPTLKQEMPTRWNSTYIMFQSFIESKEPLLAALVLTDSKVNLTIRDFNVTTSKLIPFSQGILKYFESVEKEALDEEVNKPGRKYAVRLTRDSAILAEATILDPRFKKVGFKKDAAVEKAKNSLIGKATAVPLREVDNQNQDKDFTKTLTSGCIWKHFDSLVKNKICNNSPTAGAITEMDKFLGESHLLRINYSGSGRIERFILDSFQLWKCTASPRQQHSCSASYMQKTPELDKEEYIRKRVHGEKSRDIIGGGFYIGSSQQRLAEVMEEDRKGNCR